MDNCTCDFSLRNIKVRRCQDGLKRCIRQKFKLHIVWHLASTVTASCAVWTGSLPWNNSTPAWCSFPWFSLIASFTCCYTNTPWYLFMFKPFFKKQIITTPSNSNKPDAITLPTDANCLTLLIWEVENLDISIVSLTLLIHSQYGEPMYYSGS